MQVLARAAKALAPGARASLTGPGRKPTKEGARPQQSGADAIDDLVDKLLRLPDSPEPEIQHGNAIAPAPQPLQGSREPRNTNRGRLQVEMLCSCFPYEIFSVNVLKRH